MPDSLISINRGDRVAGADYRDALPVNLYAVIKDIKDSQGYMINHPGVETFATASGVDRGGFYSDRFNAHFRVSANDFISVGTDGTITNISQQSGVSITGSFEVRFTQSFNNLAIVTDNKIWYYNPDKGLRQIDVDFEGEIVPPTAGDTDGRTFSGTLSGFQESRNLVSTGDAANKIRDGLYASTGRYGYFEESTSTFHGSDSGGISDSRYPMYVLSSDVGLFSIFVAVEASSNSGSITRWGTFIVNEDPRDKIRNDTSFAFTVRGNFQQYVEQEVTPPESGDTDDRTFVGDTSEFESSRTLLTPDSGNNQLRDGLYTNTGIYGYYEQDGNTFHGIGSGGVSAVKYPVYSRSIEDDVWAIFVAIETSAATGSVTQWGAFLVTEDPSEVADNDSTHDFTIATITGDDGLINVYNSTLGDEVIVFGLGVDGNQNALTFGEPIDIIFASGVFMMTDGEQLYHTSFANEEVVLADAVATAEFLPDGIVGLERQRDNLVVVFGFSSTEYFTPDPTDTFAFRRASGLATKVGIVSAFAKTELDGQFFVIGGRNYESTSIHIVTSGGIQTVATREIEKILATYPREELANSSLEARVEDGDKFIYVHLPNQTLLYNHTVATAIGLADAWSTLKTSVTSDDAWNGRHFIFDTRISRWICGERFGNRVGLLNNTISTLYGDDIEWIFYTKFIPLDGQSIDEIELKTISGFTSEPDNRVTISLTYDGEVYHTERYISYGSKNERDRRFIARRFGYVRNQVGFKVRGVVESRVAFGAMKVTHG